MRRVGLFLGVSVVMSAMVVLIAGSVLANDTQPEQTYVDTVKAKQYFARPGSAAWFRGTASDIPTDGDPGINGELDTMITYSGVPTSGGTSDITGGSWVLCSDEKGGVIPDLPNPQIQPVCAPDSETALQGTIRNDESTAVWDTKGGTASVPTGFQPGQGPQCISVYAGKAKVEAVFTVTGGTVNGVPVTEGIGLFKGKLDHKPFLNYRCPGGAPLGTYPATLEGTLELKF